MLLRPLLSFVALASACACLASEPIRRFSVCDLVRTAVQLDGEIVKVYGVLQDSDPKRENPYFDELVSENCKGKGMGESQAKIQVVSPDSHFLANPPAGYKPDLNSIRRAELMAEKAAAHHRSLSATVEGVLYVPKAASGVPRHRSYTAIIVVQAIRDTKER